MPKYRRVLLKFSGEQLAGKYEFGVDPDIASFLAKEVKKIVAAGTQVIIIAGGGNMVRGAEIAGHGIRRVTADQMGMLSGLINCMALTDIFEANGLVTRCLSNIPAPLVAETYSYRLAEKHLQKGRVVIIAGGTARPYVTHDTAAVSFALELDCDLVIKASKVAGVFDKDPAKFPKATKLDSVTFQQAVENNSIKAMDFLSKIKPVTAIPTHNVFLSELGDELVVRILGGVAENIGSQIHPLQPGQSIEI